MNSRWDRQGFTIVELLIVVVVIAILAAVTIVAYNGIQDRARLSVLKNDLSKSAKSLEAFKIKSGVERYPDTLAEAGVTASNGVDLQYRRDNDSVPATFCVTAISLSKIGVAYRITQQGSVEDGPCTGHTTNPGFTNLVANSGFEAVGSLGDVRRNLALNPGIETSASYWSTNSANGSVARDTAQSQSGSASLRTTIAAAGSVSTQLWDGSTTPMVPVSTNEFVTISASVRATASGHTLSIAHRWRDNGLTEVAGASTQSAVPLSTTWTRVSFRAQVPAGATYDHISFYANASGPMSWWIDDVLVEKSTSLGDYFDGSTASAGEFTYGWSGTQNLSTSVSRAAFVAQLGSNRTANISSTDWANSGSRSLLQIPTSTATNDNYSDLLGSVLPLSSLKPATQYTLMATVRIDAPITGTVSGNGSRSLFVHLNGSGIPLTGTASAPNVPGTYPLRVTFTTPASFTGYNTIRLYHGGYAGSGSVRWDDIAVVEGNYTGPYFE